MIRSCWEVFKRCGRAAERWVTDVKSYGEITATLNQQRESERFIQLINSQDKIRKLLYIYFIVVVIDFLKDNCFKCVMGQNRATSP